MTPEQQKAVAIAKARRRRAQAEAATAPPISGQMMPQTQMDVEAGQIISRDQTGFETDLQATALGLKYIYNKAAEQIPENVKEYGANVVTSMGNAFKPAMKIPTVRFGVEALESGAEAWTSFKEAHPRIAADIEAVGTIGATAALGVQPAVNITKRALFGRVKMIEDMVKPMKLKDVDLNAMTTEGVKGKAVINLTKTEKEMKKVIEKIPGIRYGNSHARNYQIIRDHNIRRAQDLNWKLVNKNTPVTKSKFIESLNKAADDFNSNFVKSERMDFDERTVFIDDMLDQSGKVNTTARLLDARKKADAQFKKFANDRRAAGELIPTKKELKWRATRDAMNDLLEELEPGYRKEVHEQHLMYKTLDVLDPKVKAEMEAAGQMQKFGGKAAKQVRALMSPRIR